MALTHPSITEDWKIENIISDIIATIPGFSLWTASKINRSANFCVHHVAYWAAARIFSDCIFTYFSPIFAIPICNGKDPPSTFFIVSVLFSWFGCIYKINK